MGSTEGFTRGEIREIVYQLNLKLAEAYFSEDYQGARTRKDGYRVLRKAVMKTVMDLPQRLTWWERLCKRMN